MRNYFNELFSLYPTSIEVDYKIIFQHDKNLLKKKDLEFKHKNMIIIRMREKEVVKLIKNYK